MAELTIRPDEIRDALANFVKSYDPGVAARDEIGTVVEAGDGIARVEGLPSTMTNELLKFENGTLGLALNLDVREIGVVILGQFTGIEEGTTVRRTGEILSVPVGDAFPPTSKRTTCNRYQSYRRNDRNRPRTASAHHR